MTVITPQAVYDQYHACYNNQTYSAFSRALATALGIDDPLTTYHEQHNQIMNLLTDTALELVGSDAHTGSGRRLADMLIETGDYLPTLVHVAILHLDEFSVGNTLWKTREKIAEIATLAFAEYARRMLVRTLDHAALIPGWRGSTAYYWLLTCTLFAQSAGIILQEDHHGEYLVEKFNKGIEVLLLGTGEIARASGEWVPAIRQFHEQLTRAQQDKH
jgi:hypothetical protein